MANALTLKILENLGKKMGGSSQGGTTCLSSNSNRGNTSGNRMTLDSYASSKGAAASPAKSSNETEAATSSAVGAGVRKSGGSGNKVTLDTYTSSLGAGVSSSKGVTGKSVVSNYENAIKSLINKSSSTSNCKGETCSESNNSGNGKGNPPKSGRIGLDELIGTLGR